MKNGFSASAMITFSTEQNEIEAGKEFTVLAIIEATDVIETIDMYLTYDPEIMQFNSGGKYISGNDGLLHVVVENLKAVTMKCKLSLQFSALTTGGGAVTLREVVKVLISF